MGDDLSSPAQERQHQNKSGTKHAPPPASMAYTRKKLLTKDQSSCPLFRLPPELRNSIYTYVFYSKYSLPQFDWHDEHESPKLKFKCAQPRAPPNELLRTCRSICAESRGIYVKAKTQFWSDTTFTLALAGVSMRDPSNFFGYLECLLEEQVNHMSRVNIDMSWSQPFKVHLRSGPTPTTASPSNRPSAMIKLLSLRRCTTLRAWKRSNRSRANCSTRMFVAFFLIGGRTQTVLNIRLCGPPPGARHRLHAGFEQGGTHGGCCMELSGLSVGFQADVSLFSEASNQRPKMIFDHGLIHPFGYHRENTQERIHNFPQHHR